MAKLFDQGVEMLKITVRDNVEFMLEELDHFSEQDHGILIRSICDDLEVNHLDLSAMEMDILETVIFDIKKELML